MNHYFHEHQHLKSNRKEFSFRFWCFPYTFISDDGVFSKGELDEGTKTLLEASKQIDLGEHILDLGCGIGCVGIILKHEHPSAAVTMLDINTRALDLAKENARLNKVLVEVIKSNIFEAIPKRTFTSIICNPPIRAGKKVVYEMLRQSFAHIVKNGYLLVVIRKSHGAKSAKTYMEEVYKNCEILLKAKGFYVLMSKKH
ncbi:MAG: class I SAM-dependent methyltransferase [Breznakia sp.]